MLSGVQYTPSTRPVGSWARICKRSRSPGIDSKESIQLGWKSIPGLLKRFPTVLLHDCTVTNVLEYEWWPVSSATVYNWPDISLHCWKSCVVRNTSLWVPCAATTCMAACTVSFVGNTPYRRGNSPLSCRTVTNIGKWETFSARGLLHRQKLSKIHGCTGGSIFGVVNMSCGVLS
jgi:hypothetical protein